MHKQAKTISISVQRGKDKNNKVQTTTQALTVRM